MFEYFGLKDVFSNINKFKYIIVIVMILFLVFGFYRDFIDKTEVSGGENTKTWSATTYCRVDLSNNYTEGQGIEGKEIELARLVSSYKGLMNSDVCYSYIYNKITQNKSIDEIIKQYNLSVKADEFNYMYFSDVVKCNILDKSNILNVFVLSENKEFAELTLSYFCEYLFNNAVDAVKSGVITQLESTTHVVKSEVPAQSATRSGMSVILMFIVGAVINMLWIFAYTFFRPTINRKSDFDIYGVKVISEIRGKL